jgi:hypothetical protein
MRVIVPQLLMWREINKLIDFIVKVITKVKLSPD